MQFLKVGLLYGASTLSRLLAGLVVVKIIAVYVGADGLGRLGQFMSLVTIVTTLAGGGISTGIVKYVAEHRADRAALSGYLGAASWITLVASLALGVLLLILAPYLSEVLLGSVDHAGVIRMLAFVQALIAASNLLMGLVNGHQRVKAFAAINIASVVLGAAGMALACARYGITGAMVGLMWMASCQLLFLLPWYRLGLGFEWRRLRPQWDAARVRRFTAFSVMLLATASTMQLTQIVIRQIIEAAGGWQEVGYWQAVVKVSDAYLQFVTVVLGSYYLPRLAEKPGPAETHALVTAAYKLALPVLVLLTGGVFALRHVLIPVIFSDEFRPAAAYFPGQLVGDFFKVAAYIVAYVAVARASTRVYVGAEVFQALLLVVSSYLMVQQFGALGATYAYAMTYMIYFVVCYLVYRTYLSQSFDALGRSQAG